MTDFDTRAAVRRAILELVQRAGGQTVTRPLIRSEPHGSTTREPEPLAGITAAVALEREARQRCLESIRYAREDGLSWRDIGDALGIRTTAVDPDDHGAGESVARFAYKYASPGHDHGDYFVWTCPSCAGLIRDYGPEFGPHEAEQGHAEGCERFAAAVAQWEEQWADE